MHGVSSPTQHANLDKKGSKLLFQIFTEREERKAIAVATNSPFAEWEKTFGDCRLCAAIADRLTLRCTLVQTGTESYRPQATRDEREMSLTQGPFTIGLTSQDYLDDLAIRTQNEGISHLAAAALIEHEGRFLLVEAPPTADFDTAGFSWELPTGHIRARETILQGLGRILAEHYGYESVQINRYLGHTDHRHEANHDARAFIPTSSPASPTRSAGPPTWDTTGPTATTSAAPSRASTPSCGPRHRVRPYRRFEQR
ncbi:ATP-binding protein [Streptomyces sp. NPDC015032]|uniref:ATP-binding protein n=1 Tax=Streptomyces sp. NPDC015032 TaxID=3364937 RepID=UPI0036F71C91